MRFALFKKSLFNNFFRTIMETKHVLRSVKPNAKDFDEEEANYLCFSFLVDVLAPQHLYGLFDSH